MSLFLSTPEYHCRKLHHTHYRHGNGCGYLVCAYCSVDESRQSRSPPDRGRAISILFSEWSEGWRDTYRAVIAKADLLKRISPHYAPDAVGDLHLHFQSVLKAPGQLTVAAWRNHEARFRRNCAALNRQFEGPFYLNRRGQIVGWDDKEAAHNERNDSEMSRYAYTSREFEAGRVAYSRRRIAGIHRRHAV